MDDTKMICPILTHRINTNEEPSFDFDDPDGEHVMPEMGYEQNPDGSFVHDEQGLRIEKQIGEYRGRWHYPWEVYCFGKRCKAYSERVESHCLKLESPAREDKSFDSLSSVLKRLVDVTSCIGAAGMTEELAETPEVEWSANLVPGGGDEEPETT